MERAGKTALCLDGSQTTPEQGVDLRSRRRQPLGLNSHANLGTPRHIVEETEAVRV
jgi:hypothetical protein